MSSQPEKALLPRPVSGFSVFPSILVWLFVTLLSMLAIMQLKPPHPVPATASVTEFSADRAMSHVRAIARMPHPVGSAANETVKEYLIAQLSSLGLNPQVFPAVGTNRRGRNIVIGNTQDVVGRLSGAASSGAMVLMAHYDSVYRAAGAADDGAGVAAILETVRALRSGPPLKNDLIVLFTDGEEAGLLGAEAFANSHPWMKDVGLILNFEARGNQGASLLFETSSNNRLLIEAVSTVAHPTGSSLFYALYQLLPNDTDFTVFRSHAVPGLNFAFGEHLEAYHSRLDTAENLSTASLQHHGSYALSLAGQFGQMDLTQLKAHTGNDIFFDWIGDHLVTYREGWTVPGQSAANVLLILAILLSGRKKEVLLNRVFMALLPAVAVLVLVPVVLSALGWLLLQLLAGHRIISDSPANSWLLAGLVFWGACAGSLLFAGFRRRFTVQELSFAGLIIVCILNWSVALVLPAASYVLFWPLLATSLGLLAFAMLPQAMAAHLHWLAGLIGTAITVLFFSPIAYLLYVFLTFQLITIVAVGLLLGLLFLICAPLLNIAIPPRKWQPAMLLLLICGTVSIAAGVKQSHYSAQHPRHDSVLYSLDADNHTAAWLSYDQGLDSWTSRFIPDQRRQPQSMPSYLAGSQRSVLSGPAPALDLAPPAVEVSVNKIEGDLHRIKMNVRSQRNANRIFLSFDQDIHPVAINLAGREIVPVQNSQGLNITFFGPFPQGADIQLSFKDQSPVAFWIMDQSYGLPQAEEGPRPQDVIASEGSDVTIVCRRYKL